MRGFPSQCSLKPWYTTHVYSQDSDFRITTLPSHHLPRAPKPCFSIQLCLEELISRNNIPIMRVFLQIIRFTFVRGSLVQSETNMYKGFTTEFLFKTDKSCYLLKNRKKRQIEKSRMINSTCSTYAQNYHIMFLHKCVQSCGMKLKTPHYRSKTLISELAVLAAHTRCRPRRSDYHEGRITATKVRLNAPLKPWKTIPFRKLPK